MGLGKLVPIPSDSHRDNAKLSSPAGQVNVVIAFDLLPYYSRACRASDWAALRLHQAARGQAASAPNR